MSPPPGKMLLHLGLEVVYYAYAFYNVRLTSSVSGKIRESMES